MSKGQDFDAASVAGEATSESHFESDGPAVPTPSSRNSDSLEAQLEAKLEDLRSLAERQDLADPSEGPRRRLGTSLSTDFFLPNPARDRLQLDNFKSDGLTEFMAIADDLGRGLAAVRTRVESLVARNEKLESAHLELAQSVNKAQFDPHELGFFEYNYSDKDLEGGYFRLGIISAVFDGEGKMQYRNVEEFIEAAQNLLHRIPAEVLRSNLHRCLNGEAHTWYHCILSEAERNFSREGEGLSNWIQLLRSKWGYRIEDAWLDLDILWFKRSDLEAKYSTGFMIQTKRIARRLGMDNTFAQLCLGYTRIDRSLRKLIPPPREEESIGDFVRRLDEMKLPPTNSR